MKRAPDFAPAPAGLRRRAEARLRQAQGRPRRGPETAPSRTDPRRLLHQLQVHKVELEMQNAELQEARERIESVLERYTDLYDFAPVGYFTLDEPGRILEVNLTGAALLGVERSRLLNRRLLRFVAPPSQSVFLGFLERVFAGPGAQACEAALLPERGAAFWADFRAASTLSTRSGRTACRVALSDITSRKRAEESQQRTEALTVANRELRREIVRREAVEAALKQSEQHQSHLLEQSRVLQEQLRYLSHRMLEAQEEERKRISRELHDEIAQTLVGINVHLEALARKARVNPRGLRQQIARTQRLVERSVHMVHDFARKLRPTALDDLGLIATLHSLMKEFLRRTGIRVDFTAFAAVDQLEGARRTVLYRVVQSALANVAQHAHASRVKVTIRKLARTVRLEISDNGRAFDVDRVLRANPNRRLGLLGMRERVEMVGGDFSVQSAPGQGTTICVEIPLRTSPRRRRAGNVFGPST